MLHTLKPEEFIVARRPTEPRYFPSRGAYFVQIRGVQHKLAEGPENSQEVKDEAWKQFHALMAANAVESEGDKNTMFALLCTYLEWVKANQAGNSYQQKQRFLQSFSNECGSIKLNELKKHHVESWLTKKSTPHWDEKKKKNLFWGLSSRRIAISCLQAAINWHKNQGYTTINPVANMPMPAAVSRSALCLISDEQHQAMLAWASKRKNKGFYYILIAMFETGARPGEISNMEARHYNQQTKAWLVEARPSSRGQFKMAHKGKRRVIHLNDTIRPIVEKLNEEHPEGVIFQNAKGKRFSANTLARCFALCKKYVNREAKRELLPVDVTPYSYRHRFVTDWLLAGKPVDYLAELLCTSVIMIHKHYSHLTAYSDRMRTELANFSRNRNSGAGSKEAGETSSDDPPSSSVAPQ